MTEPLRLQLRLLGRFAAYVEGQSEPVRLSSRKGRALLAHLAMRPDLAETRERLATLLWGDTDDSQARQSLRQCLALLRKEIDPACADVLIIERNIVALASGRVTVDAREFLRLAESGDAADIERAADLYNGAFLDGFPVDDEAFADWMRTERARIEAVAAYVFETSALQADRSGRGAVAVRAAERLVALDPLNEQAQRLLLQLLARYRGRDAALTQAQTLAALLRRELDVGLEPETQTLVAEISARAQAATDDEPASRERGAQVQPTRPAVTAADVLPPKPIPAGTAWRPRVSSHHVALSVGAVAVIIAAGTGMWAFIDRAHPPPASKPADNIWASPAIPGVTADQPWLATWGLRAVLVLPFTGSSPENKAEQALADRLSDDLISDLSRVPAMRVISRQTSIRYRDQTVDAAALGSELGVHYIVEGHLRLEGSHVTINVALTDTKSRLQVWSDRFTRDLDHRSELAEDITRGLARRLQINLVGAEERRQVPRRDAGDPAVRDLLAKGWGAVVRLSHADQIGGAEGYFEDVLKRDPENLSAKTGLAATYVQAATMFLLADPKPRLDQAEGLLKRVIATDPNITLPHFYLGMLKKNRARPYEALAAFNKVLELNPSYAPAYAQVGHVLSRIGRLNEAIEHVRYAVRLSPKDHNVGIWSLFGGQIELELGHDDVALDWLRRAVELTPRSPFAQASLAAAYAVTGDRANSAKHAEEVRRIAPSLTLEQMRERVIGLSDKGGEPRRLLEGLQLAFAQSN